MHQMKIALTLMGKKNMEPFWQREGMVSFLEGQSSVVYSITNQRDYPQQQSRKSKMFLNVTGELRLVDDLKGEKL